MIQISFRRLSGRLRRRATIARMKRADIVLASPRIGQLSLTALLYRLILKSRYVHSMLYIGEGKIIHTTYRHGVVIGKIPKKIYKKDRYSIFRVKSLDSHSRNLVVNECLRWKGMKLDYAGLISNIQSRILGLQKVLLSFEKKRIWCSKLIYKSFLAAGIRLVPENKTENITSEDLASSPWTSRV